MMTLTKSGLMNQAKRNQPRRPHATWLLGALIACFVLGSGCTTASKAGTTAPTDPAHVSVTFSLQKVT